MTPRIIHTTNETIFTNGHRNLFLKFSYLQTHQFSFGVNH